MRIHLKPSIALVIALLFFPAAVLAACGGNESTGSTNTAASTTPSTTTKTARQPFVSDLYGYSIESWTGTSAQTAWDGTGSPGDEDPTVDRLSGPESQRAFGFAEPTKDTLKKFVAKFRVTDSHVHPCPVKPEAIKRTIIAGEPAIVNEEHCPAGSGVFVLQAFTTHDGHVYVFFTYDQPGKEAEMRDWFGSLLEAVSFGA